MNIRDQLDRYFVASKFDATPPREIAVTTSRAECEHIVTVFPSHRRHGIFELDSFGGVFRNAPQMLVRDNAGETTDFGRIAFIDTETTGLSGGSGVCAFLVGLGYNSAKGFVVEQFLMNDFPTEPDMLGRVCERLGTFDTIASYNGRSFDIPILDSRLLLNGLRKNLSSLPHLDLLHPARRVWKHRLADCSLKSVEEHVLGYTRDNDIESWLIPETFFVYLRSGDRDLLEPILHHNRLDILSLACIGHVVLAALDSPHEAAFTHGADWYGLGTLFALHYRMEEAARCFERAMVVGAPEHVRRQCMKSLSLTHKKTGEWENAVELWNESSAAGNGADALFALEELAKFYEHRRRDLVSAREVCRRAIAMLEVKEVIGGADLTRHFGNFEYRLKRIEKKIRSRKA
ncbi:ribonuclease H-like domain-containing protein [Candidatus Poribacteria bacterium]|nr:ribonuclease H-like domain-containing protein [Candidatus Poribacteria bacterium]